MTSGQIPAETLLFIPTVQNCILFTLDLKHSAVTNLGNVRYPHHFDSLIIMYGRLVSVQFYSCYGKCTFLIKCASSWVHSTGLCINKPHVQFVIDEKIEVKYFIVIKVTHI